MLPLLRQWRSTNAGRERAAPHIKTYARLSHDGSHFSWFMLSSANLSKPAWGTLDSNGGWSGKSYEAGVMFEPGLWGTEKVVLVPTFRTDWPSEDQVKWAKEKGYKVIVAIRMARDIPLAKYGEGDVPWVRSRSYNEPDWLGMNWPG